MRIYLMVRDKRTTISVEDQLIQYLADRVCRGDLERAFGWRAATRKWIQKTVNKAGDTGPAKNVSQWVRARIIDEIVDPALRGTQQQSKQFMADEMRKAGLAKS